MSRFLLKQGLQDVPCVVFGDRPRCGLGWSGVTVHDDCNGPHTKVAVAEAVVGDAVSKGVGVVLAVLCAVRQKQRTHRLKPPGSLADMTEQARYVRLPQNVGAHEPHERLDHPPHGQSPARQEQLLPRIRDRPFSEDGHQDSGAHRHRHKTRSGDSEMIRAR